MALHATAKPNAKFVDETFNTYDDLWRKSREKWVKADLYYNREYPLWDDTLKAERKEEYRPATPAAYVDHAVDAFMAINPQVHRPPAGEGAGHREKADRVEPAITAILEDAALLEPVNPYKAMWKQFLLYGYSPIYAPILDLSDRLTKPQRKRGESQDEFEMREEEYSTAQHGYNPIRIRVPHPSMVYTDPFEKVPAMGIIKTVKRAWEVEDLSKGKLAQKREGVAWTMASAGKDPQELIELIEFWSKFWHAVKLPTGDRENPGGEALLYVERNTWGYQPIAHAFAGFGQIPTNASEFDPSYWCKGILTDVMDSILKEAQSQTGKHVAQMRAIYAKRGHRKLDAAEAAQQLRGAVLPGDPEDWWFENLPELQQWMFAADDQTSKDIEFGTFARALAGLREAGVSTVGQQSQLDEASGRKFISPAQQGNHLISIVASNILRLSVRLHKTYGISVIGTEEHPLRAGDIEGNYRIGVKFEQIDPVLALQEKEFALRELEKGLISPEDYWEIARKEDATGIRKRLLIAEIYADPEVHQYQKDLVMREMGLGAIVDRREAEAKAAAADGTNDRGGSEPLPSERAHDAPGDRSPAKAVREQATAAAQRGAVG